MVGFYICIIYTEIIEIIEIITKWLEFVVREKREIIRIV